MTIANGGLGRQTKYGWTRTLTKADKVIEISLYHG